MNKTKSNTSSKNKILNKFLEKPTIMNLTVAFFSACLFLLMPGRALAKSSGDIESSINSASEGVYDFITGITFWVGTAMIALGFLIMKFKWIDRQGKAGSIILAAIFGIGGVFAAPEIAKFVIDLVS